MAALLLQEYLAPATILGGLAVILCASLAVRTRNQPRPGEMVFLPADRPRT